MKTKSKEKQLTEIEEIKDGNNTTRPDNDADKTGTDKSSDSTKKRNEANKFDKPKREANPDRTGIDTKSDKTKK
jgi:hypothetical protein